MESDKLIKKRVIQVGTSQNSSVSDYEFPRDSKIKFHYVTRTIGDESKTIDDSHRHKEPMEMIIGKKFKFEPWEECLKTMSCGEISSFTVDKKLTATYPLVAKNLRDIFLGDGKTQTSHCCAMTAAGKGGLGYADLDELMSNLQPLEFILEVLSIELPGEYEKDAWAMSSDEKNSEIPRLKAEGNELYNQRLTDKAAEKYAQALGLLERLALPEKPGSNEQKDIELQKVTFLLNYAQCQLLVGEYYAAIERTTELLALDPDNVKALFRRAKAEAAVWQVEEAKTDFNRVSQLNPGMAKTIRLELTKLDCSVKQKDEDDRAKLCGKLFS